MPTFQNPVIEPDDAIQDEKLIGEWRAIDIKEDGTVEQEEDTFFIGLDPELEGWMRAGNLTLNNKKELVTELRMFLATRVQDSGYLSFKIAKAESEKNTGRFILAKYKYGDSTDRVRIFFTDPKKLKDAVERQRLRGTIVERIKQVDSSARAELEEIHIESSVQEIRTFLKKYPNTVFYSEGLMIERVKETG